MAVEDIAHESDKSAADEEEFDEHDESAGGGVFGEGGTDEGQEGKEWG